MAASAATTPLVSFDFNEADASAVKDSINGLVGTVMSADSPTMVSDSPSGQASDRAIHFESGQWIQVDDPATKVQLNPDDPSFTLQAWVKFDGNPSGRQVFFYNNGPGGAISFSVNTDRTVFVTTLGILDASSEAAIPDDGQWHHIAVVHQNGTELRYYVDGVLGATREYTSGVIFTRTQTYFSLGAEPGGGLQYVGSLDRLKVTAGILTPDQFDSKPQTGPVVDTDKDGLPDDWEIKYGLNPNDATDAAKDCNNNGYTNLKEYELGLDPCDATKPEVLSASTTGTFDTVKLAFSKDLDPSTATNIANYTISPALAVTAATYKSKVVTLTTAKQTAGAVAYTVTAKGVKDVSNFEVPADKSSAQFFSYIMSRDGVLKFSYWGDISGTPVDNLIADSRYPSSPDQVGAVFSFNSRDFFADDSHENYGATMEGYLTPTESASYRFFIYSDDASQLWLSTDDKEANLYMAAEETGCCNNFTEPDSPRTSEPIPLVAGKKYFVRLIYKEGGGGDYGQVAWRKEGDPTAAGSLKPIPGKFLSAAVDLPMPAEGLLMTQSPAANAKNVSPNPYINIVHRDGKTEWTAQAIALRLDGTTVQPTITKDGAVMTITYQVPTFLQSLSTHTLALDYLDPAAKPATMEWSFQVFKYSGPTRDSVKGYAGLIVNNAAYTPDAGGQTGKAGDYAIDFGSKGSAWVDIKDVSYLNSAAVKDELSMAMWIKKYDIANGSAFWAQRLDGSRGFQAHTPWSDDTIYFDTAGCCDGTTQRISANINTFPGYTDDDTFWKKWHHFVFTKKADQKNIYIDGQLFLNGSSSNPLTSDFLELALGTDGIPGGDYMHGLIDDFAVYSTEVSAADAAKLASGTSPKNIGATLVAYWDFNDYSAGAAGISGVTVSSDRKSLTLTYTGKLQEAAAVTGPWADVPNASSPTTVATTGTVKFYRVQ